LAGHPRAVLVPADATPAEWNDALLQSGGVVHAARVPSARIAVA
jgi:hypothetical protein